MKFTTTRLMGTLLLLLGALSARASGVVTNCTEQALTNALRGGGLVSFTNDCSITVTKTITLTVAGTSIDANGHTVTISGGGKVRILTAANTNLSLLGLTLTGGNVTNDGGGALLVNQGARLTANDCVFVGNSSVGTNGTAGAAGSGGHTGGDGQNGAIGNPGWGGAIWNRGTLTLAACTISTNTATGGDGGAGGAGGAGQDTLGQGGNGGDGGSGGPGYGGGIHNGGTLTLTDCTLGGNSSTAGNGGAGGAAGTGAFSGFVGQGGAGAVSYGGGIYNNKTLSLFRSTVAGNTTKGGNSVKAGDLNSGFGKDGAKGGNGLGGGLCNVVSGTAANSTFYGNTATGGTGGDGGDGAGTLPTGGNGGDGGDGVGGGVQNGGTLLLLNCTLASCGAYGGTNGVAGAGLSARDGTPGAPHGGNIGSTGGTCTLRNSLIIWEQFGACGYGSFSDGGYNLTSDRSISLPNNSFPNQTNPRAGNFGDHGGPTQTLSLLTNSPAIDKIPANLAPGLDQRGFHRPANTLADIGAYESESQSAPFIITQPTDQTTIQGTSATFKVSALGAAPLSYQWYFQGNGIGNATDSSYTVPSAQPANLGEYYVTISNAIGSTDSTHVELHLSPNVTTPVTNIVVVAGANVSLSATATGEPVLTYQWLRNGTNIPGATDSALVMPNIQPESSGTYSVAVVNSAGGVTNTIATVGLRPSILTQPVSQSAVVGSSNVVFNVSATGTTNLVFQWLLNGLAIAGASNSAFTNNNVQTGNAGVYVVSVVNDYGSTNSAPATLTALVPLSGHIREGTNTAAAGVPGVRLTAGTNSLTTDAFGFYTNNLAVGNYAVVPSLTNYVFSPANPTIFLGSRTVLDFQAAPLIRIGLNTNGTAQIFGGGVPGLAYVLQSSTNWLQWQAVATNTAPVQFSVPIQSNPAGTFFRMSR